MSIKSPVIGKVQQEVSQSPSTRVKLYKDLESQLGRPVVSFFTSLNQSSVMVEDSDADTLEGVLQEMDVSKGFALFISSFGGLGEAAERIINVCRNASGTGEFWAIVPSKAKSAATMICFGASKILMRDSSELGPIDPQISFMEDGNRKNFSLCTLVASYKQLFEDATKANGNLEPYLQQLQHYDHREIAEFDVAIKLAEDIGITSLASGMMKGKSEAEIKKAIKVFLTPEIKKSHGRPIYAKEARKCGLNIEEIDGNTKIGKLIYEIYVRTNSFVSSRAAKTIESKDGAFVA